MKKSMYHSTRLLMLVSFILIYGPVFGTETDQRIEKNIRQSYMIKTYLKNDDIKIDSKDGLVTLTGTVSQESSKTLAGETVGTMSSVTGVVNKLEVEGKSPALYSDAWLITKVKSTLLLHRNVNAGGTEIFADNGTVTLRGQAVSQAQLDLTIEYTKDVDGVKQVKNEMTVSDPSPTLSEKMDALAESVDDASTTALVKAALMYHRSTSFFKTTVETNEGVVTLGGIVGNSTEKDLATKVVSDVHGVKKVVNTMDIM